MCHKKFNTDIYIEKSKEAFESSVICGKNNFFNSWANRAYYSFYILSSIFMENLGIEPQGKHGDSEIYYKHSQIIKQLSFRMKADKKLKKLKVCRILNDLYNNRVIADYSSDRVIAEREFIRLGMKSEDAFKEYISIIGIEDCI
ncbi:MAG: HEPN domain-containing protein [Candidatus Muirbacterium halophilum]|nr:HEPN domain-containing protein [Candidatus Muirbacterium halophilum]